MEEKENTPKNPEEEIEKNETQEETETSSSSTAQDENNELEKKVEELNVKAEENYSLYLRTLADMENLRKRLIREKQESEKYTLEKFMKSLLPVIDSLDKALAGEKEESSNRQMELEEGLKLVSKQFMNVLVQNGLHPIESVDQKFNPDYHQALQKIESQDISEETVKDEYIKGYLLNERLLRPAMVSVIIPKAKNDK